MLDIMDILYDIIDELFYQDKFDEVDKFLLRMDTNLYSLDILLTILTATLPAKNKLRFRSDFFSRVTKTLKERNELEDNLLIGLD